ncbi:MAG: hypothetical protein AABZ40_06325 [Thermodesulfobacteriota bacterium]
MTFPTCSSFTVILIPVLYISPVSGMGIDLPAAVALYADIRIRVARLAGLQVPPRFSRMIRIPVKDLRGDGLAMGFDAHAPFRPCLAVAVRAEIRLVAAIAILGIVRRLDRMDGNKIGPVRLGHVLPSPRRTPLQIGFDAPALVTVDTEGLLMAIGAVVPRPLGKQLVLLHKESPVIAHHTRPAMAIFAFISFVAFEVPVVSPGEGQTDEGNKKKGRRQEYYFKCLIDYHGLSSHVQ